TFGAGLPVKRSASLASNPWLRMAAVLVLGVVIGRTTVQLKTPPPVVKTVASTKVTDPDSYQLTTERYLGQTVSLLVALPRQLQSGRADSAFIARASESL